MLKVLIFLALFSGLLTASNNCLICHEGIENIRDESSGMMKAILEVAQKAGYAGNDCIVCHGGNPKSKSEQYAHKGSVKYFKKNKGPKDFYAAPASSLVNENSCGACHTQQLFSQKNSLMATKQESIQNALYNFGVKGDATHSIGVYSTKNPQDPHSRLGTKEYKQYMQTLASKEPQAFPTEITQLPLAPTKQELQKDPSLAAFTYLHRQESKNVRGNFKGEGCATCHIPYSKDGYYEGADKTINKKEKGHLRVHSIQSSREAKVKLPTREYSGIPVETCATCHNDTMAIATSYQGLMQTQQSGSLDKEGKREASLHDKHYLHMQSDVHFKKGMLCQDCHTSNDMHGDGFLSGANAAAVEIECQDCHGTTSQYPWELPLGYADEFNTTAIADEARGTTKTVAEYLKQGSVSEPKDGYLLSARGNPLTHVTKENDEVIVHLASGKNIHLEPLKKLKADNKLSKKALLAMDSIASHMQSMECYSCHAVWAPQFYGSFIEIDYSKSKKKITEGDSFSRWEEPALAQNGEARISPTIPASKMIKIISKDRKVLVQNYVYAKSHVTPLQPHTMSKESRSCESCHVSSAGAGLGFVDANITTIKSVEQHFKLSAPLSQEQQEKLKMEGMCFSCHQDIPQGNLAISAMKHMASMADIKVDNKEHQSILNNILNIGAWTQVLLILFVVLIFIYVLYTVFIKKESINPKNRGWK